MYPFYTFGQLLILFKKESSILRNKRLCSLQLQLINDLPEKFLWWAIETIPS